MDPVCSLSRMVTQLEPRPCLHSIRIRSIAAHRHTDWCARLPAFEPCYSRLVNTCNRRDMACRSLSSSRSPGLYTVESVMSWTLVGRLAYHNSLTSVLHRSACGGLPALIRHKYCLLPHASGLLFFSSVYRSHSVDLTKNSQFEAC